MSTSCIPPASGVPALPGPPQWWEDDPAAPRPFRNDIDDPRWIGSVRHGHGTGANEDARFRGLFKTEDIGGGLGNKPVLYMSFHIPHDSSQGDGTDGIYVGLQGQGGQRYLIRVVAYNSHAVPLVAHEPADKAVMTLDDQGAATDVGAPPWLDLTKAWLTPPSPMNTNYDWAIALRIPVTSAGSSITNGLNLGDLNAGAHFSFWYAIVKDGANFATTHYWPRTSPPIQVVALQNKYPVDGWDDVHLGTADCGQGISITSLDIGTKNVINGMPARNTILVSAAADTTNTLFAKPANSGTSVAPDTLSATFRTANWGSQVPFEEASGSTLWAEIHPEVDKRNSSAIPSGEITYDWTITTTEAKDWIPPLGKKWTHQCLLVTLSGPYDFINDSVYCNMNFETASEFELLAQISVQGLKRRKGPRRTVFLYVERCNMPRDPEEPYTPPDVRRVLGQYGDANGNGGGDGGGVLGASTNWDQGRPPVTLDDLSAVLPTVRFHVYHDTGQRIVVGDGIVRPVAAEQTAFGHFIQHPSQVWGWDIALGGSFKKIDDNVFRLEVPEGGHTVINTKVKAWEEPPKGDRPEIEPAPKQPPDDDDDEEDDDDDRDHHHHHHHHHEHHHHLGAGCMPMSGPVGRLRKMFMDLMKRFDKKR